MEFKTCFNLGDIVEIASQQTSNNDPFLSLSLGRIVEIVVRYATAYEYDILYNVSINNGEKTVLAADPAFKYFVPPLSTTKAVGPPLNDMVMPGTSLMLLDGRTPT